MYAALSQLMMIMHGNLDELLFIDMFICRPCIVSIHCCLDDLLYKMSSVPYLFGYICIW